MRRLADEADLAVRDVDEVWTGEWSREPVVMLPRNQEDMATLIGSDGAGLAQIAAVTTGSFESGLSRGDRVVINPAAWNTLGALGRRVVLTHEMTHVATRSSSVQPVPIWLSEGFADYVAYRATPVPTVIVASDIFDDVRDGNAPEQLPDDADFDAARGDVAASYESAWLACRMIAERYGEKRLVAVLGDVRQRRPRLAGRDRRRAGRQAPPAGARLEGLPEGQGRQLSARASESAQRGMGRLLSLRTQRDHQHRRIDAPFHFHRVRRRRRRPSSEPPGGRTDHCRRRARGHPRPGGTLDGLPDLAGVVMLVDAGLVSTLGNQRVSPRAARSESRHHRFPDQRRCRPGRDRLPEQHRRRERRLSACPRRATRYPDHRAHDQRDAVPVTGARLTALLRQSSGWTHTSSCRRSSRLLEVHDPHDELRRRRPPRSLEAGADPLVGWWVDPDDPGCAAVPMDLVDVLDVVPDHGRPGTGQPPHDGTAVQNAAPSATTPVPEMPLTSWSRCSWKRPSIPSEKVAAGRRGGPSTAASRWASWWRHHSRQLAM